MSGKAYCFLCGFVWMMALGVVVSSRPSGWLAAVLLLTPLLLLVLWFALPAWRQAVEARRARVFVYVPPEERAYPGQTTRPYIEQECEQREVW
jgi:hypothetical protein